MSLTQSHSRGDQERKEGVVCTEGTADTGGAGGIEADGFEGEKTGKAFAEENVAFGAQFMEVDEEDGNAVASCCGMFDRRFMIGGRIGVLLLNSSM